MEREVSTITMLGVAMCMLAALLSIVMVTVSIGNYIKASAYEEFDGVQVKMESGALKELVNTDKEMSVAAVFGIMQNSEDYIESITYKIRYDSNGDGVIGDTDAYVDDIQKHLSGRCRLEVEHVESSGMYRLTLHQTKCRWMYDSCICGVGHTD